MNNSEFIFFDCPTKKFLINRRDIIWAEYDCEKMTFKINIVGGSSLVLPGVTNYIMLAKMLGVPEESFKPFIME